jgi:hypothetical protein
MAQLTPLSFLPWESFAVSLTANQAVVEFPISPYSNTREIQLHNTSGTTACLVRVLDAGSPPALPAAASVTSANSLVISPQERVVLRCGTEGVRNAIALVSFWAANPGSNLILVGRSNAGQAVSLNVTYVQASGGQVY